MRKTIIGICAIVGILIFGRVWGEENDWATPEEMLEGTWTCDISDYEVDENFKKHVTITKELMVPYKQTWTLSEVDSLIQYRKSLIEESERALENLKAVRQKLLEILDKIKFKNGNETAS